MPIASMFSRMLKVLTAVYQVHKEYSPSQAKTNEQKSATFQF